LHARQAFCRLSFRPIRPHVGIADEAAPGADHASIEQRHGEIVRPAIRIQNRLMTAAQQVTSIERTLLARMLPGVIGGPV
jgi:hypothetical protein